MVDAQLTDGIREEIPVLLFSKGDTELETTTNQFGEFNFSFKAIGHLGLLLEHEEVRFVVAASRRSGREFHELSKIAARLASSLTCGLVRDIRRRRVVKRSWVLILAFTGLIAVPSSRAQQPGLIVRDTLGLTHLSILCPLLGCRMVENLGDPLNEVFLVTPTVIGKSGWTARNPAAATRDRICGSRSACESNRCRRH